MTGLWTLRGLAVVLGLTLLAIVVAGRWPVVAIVVTTMPMAFGVAVALNWHGSLARLEDSSRDKRTGPMTNAEVIKHFREGAGAVVFVNAFTLFLAVRMLT